MKNLIGLLLILFVQNALIAQTSDSMVIMKRLIQRSQNQSEKLHFINHLVLGYWDTNTDSALYFGRLGLDMIKKDPKPTEKAKLLFTYGIALKYSGKTDSAYHYLYQARKLAKKINYDFLYYRILEQTGNLYRENGEYDSARILIEKSADYFKSIKDEEQTISALINLGSVWIDQNRNAKALQYYQEAFNNKSIASDTISYALTLLGIGLVYENLGTLFQIHDHQKSATYLKSSIEYYNKSYKSFSKIKFVTGIEYASMNLISVFLKAGMINQADSVFRNSGILFKSHDQQVVVSYRALYAKLLMLRNKRTEALHQLRIVLKDENKKIVPNVYYESLMQMAELFRYSGLTDSAFQMAGESVRWFMQKQNYVKAFPEIVTLSKWLNEDGKSAEAYTYLTKATLLYDSLFLEATNEIFDETGFKYEKDLLQSKIKTIASEKELNNYRYKITILVISVIVLLLTSFILFLNQRRRKLLIINQQAQFDALQYQKENILKDQTLKELKVKNELAEHKANNKQLELQIKEQELVYQSLRQADIVKFNKTTIQKLIPFQLRMTRKKDQEAFGKLISEISQLTEQNALSDFELMFSQMHGDFHKKLIEIAPDLSRSELQIAALLRMNLPSKEIARLTNLSLATVDLTRHHIRQKLKLETCQNLIAFLIML